LAKRGKPAAKSKKPKGESPQLQRWRTRVKNLESKLSESVPKTDLEALKGRLEGKVSELQAELARSVPKSDADALRARIGELQGRLSESVPKGQLEEASRRVGELETSNRALEAGKRESESLVGELRSRIQGLELKESSQADEIAALKGRAADVDARANETMENIKAVTKRARYRKEDNGYWIGNEDWQELRGLLSPLSMEEKEHKFEVSGRCAGCGMTENDFRQALSILETWPEDSEKKERMAELKTCKNDLAKPGEREFVFTKSGP
jgi:uncharacterized coiled-coil protein SlyX